MVLKDMDGAEIVPQNTQERLLATLVAEIRGLRGDLQALRKGELVIKTTPEVAEMLNEL